MTVEPGRRVAVRGSHLSHDGKPVGGGEVGYVVGHRGMTHVVVMFEGEQSRYADVPITDIRVLTRVGKGR